ncbi:hypothetical protein GJ744_002825 [Endocarpon pusillum]|uniref:NB-ARC domain-containing protein n=1 Tax=Endocarpon pusillum TaxID=364733 RepID=A0A8H7A7H0_9EURO|nr:hypothetical protein GJ744_002825 [Endocarpon pusillum]
MFDVGKKLSIPGIEDEKADVKRLVKQWLSNQPDGQWLLVLDNADNQVLWGKRSDTKQQEFSLVEYLPRTTNGSILVTTRSRQVATFLAGKQVIALSPLSLDEATEMFTDGLGTPSPAENRTALETLVERLARLPLAIVQASAYINKTQLPMQSYLNLLEKPEATVIKLLSKDFGDPSRYKDAINPVATTWLISFEHIRKYHPLAIDLLSSMACFHEKSIPRSLVWEDSSEIDEVDIIDAVAVLTGYAFVIQQSDSIEESYNMHRLVQLAVRNWLRERDTLHDWMKACTIRLARLFPSRNHKYKTTWTRYLPHAQRISESNDGEDFPERYQLLEKMG